MRPWPILLPLLSLLLWPPAGRAQETIDAAKITCNQFMFGRIADSRTISIWLIGYYSGMRNNSVIDTAAVQKQAQDLVQYAWLIPKQVLWTLPKPCSTLTNNDATSGDLAQK